MALQHRLATSKNLNKVYPNVMDQVEYTQNSVQNWRVLLCEIHLFGQVQH